MIVNIGLELEDVVIIIGIGCFGRLLGYINFYGVYFIYGCVLFLV